MKPLKARDQVAVYVGKERLIATVVGPYDEELYPEVYRVQLRDFSFLDAHRSQIRKLKPRSEPRRFFIARFEGPTMTPEGLSLPKDSMIEAQALADRGQKLSEILEVVEVKRHALSEIPPRPAFLEKKPTEAS